MVPTTVLLLIVCDIQDLLLSNVMSRRYIFYSLFKNAFQSYTTHIFVPNHNILNCIFQEKNTVAKKKYDYVTMPMTLAPLLNMGGIAAAATPKTPPPPPTTNNTNGNSNNRYILSLFGICMMNRVKCSKYFS